jgi:dTMP kinase
METTVSPRGLLVAIEGIDGAGKSTQADRLVRALATEGREVVRTREPTDGPWGRRIRASAATVRMTPEEELHAFVEDRREHVATVIAPSLEAGKVVVIDRYYFSSAAYQGARGLDPEMILARNEAFAPRPDLLVILELDPAEGMRRVGARGASDLFEREDDLRRVATIFAKITHPPPLRLDATLAADILTQQIIDAVRARLR